MVFLLHQSIFYLSLLPIKKILLRKEHWLYLNKTPVLFMFFKINLEKSDLFPSYTEFLVPSGKQILSTTRTSTSGVEFMQFNFLPSATEKVRLCRGLFD